MDRCYSVSSTNRLRTYVNPKKMMVRSNLLSLDSYSSPDRLKRARQSAAATLGPELDG
jgi:hypothetical protein